MLAADMRSLLQRHWQSKSQDAFNANFHRSPTDTTEVWELIAQIISPRLHAALSYSFCFCRQFIYRGIMTSFASPQLPAHRLSAIGPNKHAENAECQRLSPFSAGSVVCHLAKKCPHLKQASIKDWNNLCRGPLILHQHAKCSYSAWIIPLVCKAVTCHVLTAINMLIRALIERCCMPS